MLRTVVLVLTLSLAACASSKRPEVLDPVEASVAGARTVDIAVASARQATPDGRFGDRRAKALSYQSLTISIPPGHQPGRIEWPTTTPGNPAQAFVTTSNRMIDRQAFLRAVEARLPPSGEVLVFVHGYNTNHEDAVFRLAQLKYDSGVQAAGVAFSWPSRGTITDYVTDRESSLAARSRLAELLAMLAGSPRVRGINLFAHSMGGMLAMETLVQAKLRGDGEFGGKLDVLVLANPDIDADVFLEQFAIIGRRPRPTVILTSRDDRALNISRRIAGDVVRVGAASARDPASVAAIERYGFTVIDMTGMQTDDPTNHVKFAASPRLLQQMGASFNAGLGNLHNPVGALIADTAGAILEAPANLLHSVAR